MSHCIAILKVILFGFPRRKGGWSPKHPCAQTVRVERGLRKGIEPLQGAFVTCLKFGASAVYFHSYMDGLLYFRILKALSKALFHLVLIIQ